MKPSDRLFAVVGPLFMLGLLFYQASLFGTRWEFGRYGMPHTLVDASGFARPDGTPLDSLTLMLVRSGIEEEAELLTCGVLAVILTLLVLTVRKGNVLRKQLADNRAERARWESQRGRRQSERPDPHW